ncbi:DUF6238 family protein [Streptomyces sp. B6B3]|uniref:DUF6238 family protein n=1 Tax=Streptomyces sp. B6B3 TaxID=3153570 RepID=UPI00325F8232
MPGATPPSTLGFLPFATAALDFHRSLDLPGDALVVSRTELDTVHAHLVALHGLLDAHAVRAGSPMPNGRNRLRAASIRVWQAADHLHATYHAAPRTAGNEGNGLPEGAPELTICQRHQAATRLVRRRTTPADLRL